MVHEAALAISEKVLIPHMPQGYTHDGGFHAPSNILVLTFRFWLNPLSGPRSSITSALQEECPTCE